MKAVVWPRACDSSHNNLWRASQKPGTGTGLSALRGTAPLNPSGGAINQESDEMKKVVIAASALALLAASSLTVLADEANGTIQSIDTAAMTVTLDDGKIYKLPAGADVASLKVGDKVKIEFSADPNGDLTASSVEPAA
jgi:hypothetical protein